MGLTSKKVLLAAALLALALFAATVWLWPRLAGRGLLPVLGRVGALLATQLALVAALGLAANYSFGFYASWADLFGLETTPGVVVDHAAGSPAEGALRVLATLHVNVAGGSVPRLGGQIQKIALGGGLSGITTTAYVYLPPQYFAHPHRRFPAALVLTGYPGTAEALFKKLKYPVVAAGQVRRGAARPMILVMMRPTVAPPRDTECTDVPGGPRTETFFATDLRRSLAARYRIGAGAASWGVIGDSTGGYCALKLALRNPGSYGAAVGLSADYGAPEDATTGDLYGGSPARRASDDLMWRLGHLPHPPVDLLVTSSRHGERNYRATLRFIALAGHGPTRVSSIILPSGGHNFTTWAREIPPALEWLSAHLAPS
ncbi:esterase family protein [Streptomyces cocklensis]|uniref:Esterase n=1 Tax=Actinacidiphila cocklensis TaxID=887465 RepID=A0A9W4GQV6_9ACTN|nr:alpha/beta hydrolase-fold protein [Actinacidiphila cocklensis]MDD1057587.1 esterase family protein [Actinacidiphila cocklensis]CAG6393782.1 Putative esterase [Actinacidiphila cocklensis]